MQLQWCGFGTASAVRASLACLGGGGGGGHLGGCWPPKPPALPSGLLATETAGHIGKLRLLATETNRKVDDTKSAGEETKEGGT